MPGSTVLVIDDSPTIGKLVQLVLTKAGHRVVHAVDVEGGLGAAREDRPQLILLDALLGGAQAADAGTICWALEADPTMGNVPIILMLTKGDARDFARFANVTDSITKPFAPEALSAVIAHVLEARAAAPDETATSETTKPRPTPLPLHPDTPPARTPTAEVPVAAALSGDLSLVSIADVLTLLQDEAQTGTLTLAKDDMRIELHLRGGRVDLALARGVADEFLLGRFLVEARQIGAAALDDVIAARVRAEGDAARPLLGADLMTRGLVSREGLVRAMTLQTSALLFEGLRWGKGRFWFQVAAPGDLPEAARDAALTLGIDALLLEGFRRVDEWRLIEREIGDFDAVFVRHDDKLSAFGRGKLLREELAVLELVNGKNSVRDIVTFTKIGSFDVSKMLYRLLRTKLIRRRVSPVLA